MFIFPKKVAIIFLLALFTDPFGAFANSTTLSVSVNNPQCRDTLDNDGDGTVDFPADAGCTDVNDNDETNSGGGGGGADTTPPGIALLSPADNAVNVSTTTKLIVDFNENVTVKSGNIRIKKTSDAITVQTIAAPSGQVVLSPSSRITVMLSAPLLEGVSYYVEIDAGIVSDGAGNTFSSLSGSTSWNFTTAADVTPPTISKLTTMPAISSAGLAWMTNESAISSFFWGTTTSYGSGSGAEVFYSLSHSTTLAGLLPGMLYYYSIEARDVAGNKGTTTGSFTTLPSADTTSPANPSGFTATAGTNSIGLSWTNPTNPDFGFVKIMRSASGYPATPSEGTLVYQGTAKVAFDASVDMGVRYYYTVFARDTSLNYSSGAIASAIIVSTPIVVPPAEETLIPSPVTGGTPTITPPIIAHKIVLVPPPVTETTTLPLVAAKYFLAFSGFDFFKQGEVDSDKKISPKGDEVSIEQNGNLKISLKTAKIPPGAKLFIVSMKVVDTGKVSSYLLSKNDTGTGYEVIFTAPKKQGKYPINIKIYDAYNEALSDVNGVLGVTSPPAPFFSLLTDNLMENITPTVQNVAPVAIPVGVAVGVSQAVVLAGNIGSFYDLYLLFLKLLGLLTGLFRKKRPESWGVVYDSVTKQPIDPAYVVVEHMEQGDKKSAITDLDGRYGFLLSPGHYSLLANKTHYKFPSDKLAGRERDELYDNLYFGSAFELAENQIVRYNIPLDPVEFDWNEFAKNKGKIFSLYSRKQKLRLWVFNVLFYAGLVITAYGTILLPTKFNASVLGIYGVIIVFQALWKYKHRVTNLIDGMSGQPIPFAIVSATVSGVGVLIKKVVTDQFGRFYLLVQPGNYDITVQEKQLDGSYMLVYRRENVYLKKGVLDGNIIVGE